MDTLEMSEFVHRTVNELIKMRPSDEVVIITDPDKLAIARAFAYASEGVGASTATIVIPKTGAHNKELPPTVAAAMKEADIMISANTYAISHTKARREATAAGTRYVSLRGVTEEMIKEGLLDADIEEVVKLTKAVGDIHSAATAAHVTSPEGTDLRVDLTGRDGLPNLIGYPDGDFVGVALAKSGIAPVEGSGQGRIVFDYSFDNLGILDEPMTMTIEDGLVTDIEGGTDAQKLRTILENEGECAKNLAEAPSLGTNPDAQLTGHQSTDKKKLGTINFAIGDNVSLGGNVECNIHLDGIILNGTLVFDGETFGGETLITNGEFDIEKAFEMADRAAEVLSK